MDLWFYPDDELEKTEKISCQVKQILEDKRREEQQQCILDHQFVLDSRPSSLPRFSPRNSHPHTPISPHSSVSNTPTTELNYDENGGESFDEDYDPAYITNTSLSNNGSFTATTNPILHNASNVPATIRRSTSNYSISSNISASTTTTRRSTKSKSKKNINCELDNAREIQNFENRIKDRTNWDETAVASHEQIKQAMHLLSSSDSHDLKLIYSIVQVLVDRINEKDDRNKQLDQLVHKMLSNNRYLIQQNQHLIWQQQQHYQQQQMQQQQLREKIRGMNRTRSSSTSFHDDSVHANDTFLSSSQSNNNNNNFMSNNCNTNNMNNSMHNNMHNHNNNNHNNHMNNDVHRDNNDECSPYSPCSSPLPLSPFQFADYDGSSDGRITSQDKVFQIGNPPYANDDHYYSHYYYNDANDDDIYDSEQVNYGRARAEGSVQEFDTDNYFAEDFMDEYPTGFDEKLDGDDDEKHNDEQQDKENGSSNHALFELDFSSAIVEDLEYLKRYYGEYNNNHQNDDCCSNDGSDDGSNEVPIGSYEAILHRIESVYDDYIRNQKRRKHSKQGKRRHK